MYAAQLIRCEYIETRFGLFNIYVRYITLYSGVYGRILINMFN